MVALINHLLTYLLDLGLPRKWPLAVVVSLACWVFYNVVIYPRNFHFVSV